MDITESISMAVKTLSANRLRSLLTVLGIIIGNASVIAMVGIGEGAQRYTTAQLQSLGPNLLFVFPSAGDARRGAQGGGNTLMLADAEAIVREIPSVKEVAAQISSQSLVTYQGNATRTSVIGTTSAYPTVRNSPVDRGRFLTPVDVDTNGLVVVLGSQLAQDLFGNRSPMRQSVRINNISFEVVGVMAAKGSSGSGNQDQAAYVPISTMSNLLAGRTSPLGISVGAIFISAQDEASVDIAEYQITNLLRLRHQSVGPDDFTVRNQSDTLEAANNVTGALTILLAATAGISLLVGGIGIMNIMLASVSERTSEIGLRKALGASRGDILQQFMVEALILALAGGVIGTVLGSGAIVLVGMYTPLQAQASVGAIVLAVSVSGGIGLFFGIFPARQAARLDPIQALRNL
ncbi:MAG: ABC transporter permease [Scytolyngbya sp. HA4215-MV1]|jgi:putative ABC transport system permease protein|nr:ABC transporter permease [Scytolyngbya sp. HA4215-MV1]